MTYLTTTALILALSLGTSISWAQGSLISMTEKQRQNIGVVTAALPVSGVGEIAGLPAKVTVPSNQIYIISTQMPSMVTRIWVGTGDTVRKGQPLLNLESAAVAETQKSFQQARSQDQIARRTLARDELLWKDGIISESRLFETQARASEASALLAERSEALRLTGMSEDQIRKVMQQRGVSSSITLHAPIDGVVIEKSVEAGQWVDSAITMFKIAKLSPLSLEIQAPATLARNIKVGNPLAIPEYAANGKVTAVGRSLSNNSQSVLIRATLDKGIENLNVGQFVEATIKMPAGNFRQWQIPNQAIARIAGQPTIYISTPDGFRAQNIRILSEGPQNSIIDGPLKGDEKIAVQGVSALKSISMGIGGGE